MQYFTLNSQTAGADSTPALCFEKIIQLNSIVLERQKNHIQEARQIIYRIRLSQSEDQHRMAY